MKKHLSADKVTIRDVAKQAGTSIVIVSYDLSGVNRYLRPELRDHVRRAAQELGMELE